MMIVPGERRPFRHNLTTARSWLSITLTKFFMTNWTWLERGNYHDTHELFAPFHAPPAHSLWIAQLSR